MTHKYFAVTYLTEDEVEHFTYVRVIDERGIPIAVAEQNSSLKRVVSQTAITAAEYAAKTEVTLADSTAVIDDDDDNDKYKPAAGRLLVKNGKLGERYVVPSTGRVFEIRSISPGSVSVVFKPGPGSTEISRGTEVVPFNKALHAKLLAIKKKPKEESA